MKEIEVKSTLDGSLQPSLLYVPQTEKPVPLVVGMHTWSFDRNNQVPNYLPLCEKQGWALLLPEFRGPNLHTNPLCRIAAGSRLARQDVLDAVRLVCENYPIDTANLFLLGCSGGGHAALLAAEDAPELYRAVDVWCPVTNLEKWHRYQSEIGGHYAAEIEACMGGRPEEVPQEYSSRSPSSQTDALKHIPVSIHHGRHDPVIPFRHSVEIVEKVESTGNDQLFLDIFDGGHEQMPSRSFEWFAKLIGNQKVTIDITG